jgi:hypothetical protein
MKRAMGAVILMAAMVVSTGTMTVLAQEGMGSGSGERGGAFAGGQMVRGTVTAATADHLTVKTDAGEVYQVAVSANTRLMKDRQPVKIAEIKVGDGAGAMGVLDAPTKTIHAVFVTVIDAAQVKKMKEDLGKVYISGKVTAIDDVKLTVMRPDGVSQVIEVDEGTSFRRGGRGMMSVMNGSGPVAATGGRPDVASGAESITLADVKVGDTVVGPGGLKNGVFVPTQLGVMDAAAMGQRRRRAAEGSDAAPANSVATPKAAAPVAAPNE